MSFLVHFPDPETLLNLFDEENSVFPMKVNNHIHTPYSFSAFETVTQAVRMAVAEELRILGINDFYVTDGYKEFTDECIDHGMFPLLNIELIGISKEDQEAGIRVNDPSNPGRIYISGKGLSFEGVLPDHQASKLQNIVKESNRQVSKMVELLNEWLRQQDVSISLTVDEIMEKLAVNLLRERHVAKMMRLKLEERAASDQEYDALISSVYGGNPSNCKRSDIAGTEDELRSKLLKAGAPAFVPEDEKAFPRLEEIMQIIRDAGGIPTYPLLLDGAGEHITEFENGKELLYEVLERRGFKSVEFIPLRNDIQKLKEYATYFYDLGFVVSFGTEHNTSAMRSMTVSCKGDVPLDDALMEISFLGAAYLAAHQYLVAREGNLYQPGTREEMERLGRAIFQYYFNTYNPSLADN
ncbi:MAG: hypothetical protein ABFS38_15435 [Bacteroidota bacterium]